MPNVLLRATLCAGILAFTTHAAFAHGGQYRGPGDVVPPGPTGPGGNTPGPSEPGPTTPGPTTPTAPTPTGGRPGSTGGSGSGPGNPGGGAGHTPGRAEITEDLTEWTFWWEFNKDRYLGLKAAVHDPGATTSEDEIFLGKRRRADTLKPTSGEILNDVLPALKRAIDATNQNDIVSSCMVAMAKAGANHPDFDLVDVFAPRLQRPQQEVRETAALAIGIAGIAKEKELDLLRGLVLDDATGRAAYGKAVDARTRSFAAYGLGLLARRSTNPGTKEMVFEALQKVLEDTAIGNRNVKVAAIQAIGVLEIGSSTPADQRLLERAVDCLAHCYGRDAGPAEQLVQSHCPTAIAKLLGRDRPASREFEASFANDLRGKGRLARASHDIARSCALAIGQLARPDDEAMQTVLLDVYRSHRDAQTRWFAALALGRIGGKANRDALLRAFAEGSKNQQKPWLALALGILEFDRRAHEPQTDPDRLLGERLQDAFTQAKDPSLVGALAIALGLSRTTDAAPALRERMLANTAKEQMAGYLCIGLALMRDRDSCEDLHGVLRAAERRPTLLSQAAVALGKLGDKRAAEALQRRLEDAGGISSLATLAAFASAIGTIGDRRSIRALDTMLGNEELRDLPRAFAAVALGGIADKDPLPWNSCFGADTNYRAAVETLTNGSTGILDIL